MPENCIGRFHTRSGGLALVERSDGPEPFCLQGWLLDESSSPLERACWTQQGYLSIVGETDDDLLLDGLILPGQFT